MASHSSIRFPRVAGLTPQVDFVPVLAAYPGPENEPPRSELGDVSELAGYQRGMTQCQQVHARARAFRNGSR
jgi:hypothetical protein